MAGRLVRRIRRQKAQGIQNSAKRRRVPAPHARAGTRIKKSPGLASVRKLVEAWAKTRKKHSDGWKVAQDFAKAAAGLTLANLTAVTANTLMAEWTAKRYTEQTLYGKRKYLRRILLHLEACGGSHTPLAQLAKIKRPRPRGIIATPIELAALRKAAAPWEACWLEIAAGHGLRFAEAKRLAAIHYNAEHGTITYPTKGHDFNQLPVTPELKNFFDTAPQDSDPHRPLLERLAGTHLSKGMMYSAWHRLLKRAGANPKLIPHDLRRTLADRVYSETKDLRMAQQILGHRDLATTTMYLEHKHPEDVRGLLDALSQGKPYVPQPRRGAFQN